MLTILFILRVANILIWLTTASALLPSVRRVYEGASRACDDILSVFFIVALVIAGFSGRWLIWRDAQHVMTPDELTTWAVLQILTAFSGLALILLLYRREVQP